MIAATKEAYDLLHYGALTLAEVEETGIRIDTKYLKRTIEETTANIKKKEGELRESPVYEVWRKKYGEKTNLGSKKQLGDIIFKELGHKRSRVEADEDEEGTKNDEKAFEFVDEPFVKDYFATEKLKKANTTYLKGILRETVDGRLHPFFNLHIAQTYRSSSDSPNFQNMPVRNPEMAKLIRSAFIPTDNNYHFVEADFGGIEVKVAACYHKDPTMLKYIKDPTRDMHRDMAAQCYLLDEKQVNKNARYCTPSETPILLSNGKPRPISKIKIGDKILGWTRVAGNRKRLIPATVTAIHQKKDKVVKITMSSGRKIRCTADHLWLSGNTPWSRQHGQKEAYVPAKIGKKLCFIADPLEPLPKHLQRQADWLSGMYDGEGCKNVIAQSRTHNPEICERLEMVLDDLGIPWKYEEKYLKYYLLGGLKTAFKMAIWCKCAKSYWRDQITSASNFLRKETIVSIEPDGEETVYGLTTETGNYIAWGYASKNCAKNMFVFPQFYGDYYINCARNLWGAIDLLKLTVGDTDTPLKKHLKKKGIHSLGKCDPEIEAEEGTFEYHLQRIEKHFWNKRFPVYTQWKKRWFEKYQQEAGFMMKTGFACNGVFNRKHVINYPIQGSAFHCLLWCLIKTHQMMKKEKMRSRIVGQIHDSIVADVHKSELKEYTQLVYHIMTELLPEAWKWIIVPLEVEIEVSPRGKSWYEKQPYKLAA